MINHNQSQAMGILGVSHADDADQTPTDFAATPSGTGLSETSPWIGILVVQGYNAKHRTCILPFSDDTVDT
jgi:hypothetical protein